MHTSANAPAATIAPARRVLLLPRETTPLFLRLAIRVGCARVLRGASRNLLCLRQEAFRQEEHRRFRISGVWSLASLSPSSTAESQTNRKSWSDVAENSRWSSAVNLVWRVVGWLFGRVSSRTAVV